MTDAAAPSLSIIVVSYNTREMTLECLRSVYAETRAPFELIVVDNASSDGSAEAIAAEFPDLRLMAETVNHGFAAANNLAAKGARGEYLLLLNPDTVVLDGALDKLLAFARRRPEARIWGGRTLYGDRSLNPSSCWRRMDLWSLLCRATGLATAFPNNPVLNSEGYGGWDRTTEREVDIVTGCLFLISRADWEMLGGFDPAFFMYAEEADLCLRARQLIGARPRVTPDSVIIHYTGASQTARADKLVRVLKAKGDLIDRHFPGWQRGFARGLLMAYPSSRQFAAGLLRRRGEAARQRFDLWSEVNQRRAEWER